MNQDHSKAYKCHYMTRRFWSDVRFRPRVSLDHTSSNNRLTRYNYLEMLKIFFWHIHVQRSNSANYYFQQDGATPHTTYIVQKWLYEEFSNRFVDKKKWPPRSPDINPCDFYLWAYLKSIVITEKIR